MGAGKIDKFGGMLPAWSERLLPPGQAALAQNTYLFSGELIGWRLPKLLRALLNGAAKRAFRVPAVTKSVATAALTFIANPSAGDTVKIGQDVYTFRGPVSGGGDPFSVLIGANANATALNFFDAVTGDAGLYTNRGSTYGLATEQSQFVDESGSLKTPPVSLPNTISANVATFYAPDVGAAYNNVLVSESTGGVRMQWSAATFLGGTNATFDSTIAGSSTWLEFIDPDTDIVRSPVVNDQFNRLYFASPSQAPQYNTYDRIALGQNPFLLGIPAPGCAPTVAVTGGSDLAQLGFPTSTSAASASPGANKLFLVPITPTGAMQIDSIEFMPASTDATGEFAGCVYNSDGAGGAPGTLLNVGGIVIGCTSGVGVISTFTNPSGLLANVKYWIGVITDSNFAIQFADDLANAGNVIAPATFGNAPPDPAPAMAQANQDWQLWANLTTSAVLEARAYVYTWVSAYAEEGPPSPSTIVTGWSNGVWSIGLYQPPPDDQGVVKNISLVRIYRTIPDQGGGTNFFLVAEQPIGTAQYVDVIDDSVVALKTILPSVDWFGPPAGLQGIIAMPNGMIAGFKANEVWFCEPYQPHAWPAKYVITVEFPVVGLGVQLNSLVVATSGNPYIATGETPSGMTLTKVSVPEPCLSRGSVLSTDAGVYYCSPNGLIKAVQSGDVSNITEMWITRERWRALVPQKNLRAVLLQSMYFCFGTTAGADVSVAQQGFTIELAAADARGFSIFPEPGGHHMGFVELTAPNSLNIDNVMIDPWSGAVTLIQNGNVNYYDFNDQAPALMPYKWRSAIFVQPEKKNYEAMRITFNVPPGTPAQSATRNETATDNASWSALQAGQYGVVRVFANPVDGPAQLVTVRELRKDSELLRILSGFKAFEWQFEFESIVQISNIQFATSVKELRKI